MKKLCEEWYWTIVLWPVNPYFVVRGGLSEYAPMLFRTRKEAAQWWASEQNTLPVDPKAKPRIVRVSLRELPKRRRKGA